MSENICPECNCKVSDWAGHLTSHADLARAQRDVAWERVQEARERAEAAEAREARLRLEVERQTEIVRYTEALGRGREAEMATLRGALKALTVAVGRVAFTHRWADEATKGWSSNLPAEVRTLLEAHSAADAALARGGKEG